MTVDQYMTRNPITVGPETTAEEIVRLLVQHRIGCVPVVDVHGALLGLITERELFLQERRIPFSSVITHSLMGAWVEPGELERSYEALRQVRASDIMTRFVATIAPSTPTGEAARMMVKLERNHLPVLDHGRLAGILARHDLLRALLRRYEAAEPAGTQDCGSTS